MGDDAVPASVSPHPDLHVEFAKIIIHQSMNAKTDKDQCLTFLISCDGSQDTRDRPLHRC